ncbi:FxsA family protein [Cereibacter changlensis]|uniref:Exclusion protein FxsA n=2 Tax=Cereibacter changlensis TaxID=402884 RepID=A0A2T4K0Z8_9RHOB|nr:FxsA family protein [Cereibacter changlensis]PTE23806.1 exclusion protein FxsA [Cereibacter changlensis JA139]PZX58981.1 UPF0716 protein FxsA [Cereibacter changlensis]
MRLFIALILVPLIEIGLFVTVGAWLGLAATLLIVLGTAVLGITLLRRQGVQAATALRMPLKSDPLAPIADGALVAMASVLLILPGFFTDTLGALLLIPPLRRLVVAQLAKRVTVHAANVRSRQGFGDMPIDGEYIDLDTTPSDRLRPPPSGPSGWTRH